MPGHMPALDSNYLLSITLVVLLNCVFFPLAALAVGGWVLVADCFLEFRKLLVRWLAERFAG